MKFQVCPICRGTGYNPNVMVSSNFDLMPKCPTCKGTRMIDEHTGLPPEAVLAKMEKDSKKNG